VKDRALLVALGLVLLLGQALLQGILPPWIRPDLLLVFALALGLRERATFGLLLAFLAGFAVDALSGAPLGLFALLRGTACAATRALDGALYLRAPAPWAVFVAAYAAADLLLMGLCLYWFLPGSTLPWTALLLRMPGVAFTSALVAPALFVLTRRLDSERAREGGMGLLVSSPRQ
jgi:rod shape-determining protein MreD